LGNVAFALLVHWCFQGLLYADRTERIFKVSQTLVLTVVIGAALSATLMPVFSLLTGLLLAHTLAFLANSHPYVVLKHFGLVKTSRRDVDQVILRLAHEGSREPAIEWAAVYGSLARNEWHETSDLDVRLVRRPGWLNGIRGCWFLQRQRAIANWSRFPLDMYVLDSRAPLSRMKSGEGPLVIVDKTIRLNGEHIDQPSSRLGEALPPPAAT
jgi:predicted nucleotidyltransferase